MTQTRKLNELELIEYGRELGRGLAPGSVIALSGELGAGKTTLAKAIAEGLGVTEPVTSPTFTIIHEYKSGRLPLYHFDIYRLGMAEDELEQLGYEEYLYGNGVTIIEWADRAERLLPENAYSICIEYADEPEMRVVCTKT